MMPEKANFKSIDSFVFLSEPKSLVFFQVTGIYYNSLRIIDRLSYRFFRYNPETNYQTILNYRENRRLFDDENNNEGSDQSAQQNLVTAQI